MAHFEYAAHVKWRVRIWMQAMYAARVVFYKLIRQPLEPRAEFIEVWCPEGHRHPTLVWTHDRRPYDGGLIQMSDCPEDTNE